MYYFIRGNTLSYTVDIVTTNNIVEFCSSLDADEFKSEIFGVVQEKEVAEGLRVCKENKKCLGIALTTPTREYSYRYITPIECEQDFKKIEEIYQDNMSAICVLLSRDEAFEYLLGLRVKMTEAMEGI